jgi:hypothetical protein
MPRFALFSFATRNNPELGIMSQGMQRHGLVDPGGLARPMEGATELPRR